MNDTADNDLALEEGWESIGTTARELLVELDTDELAARGQELGRLENEIRVKEDERRSVMKNLKARIDDMKGTAKDLATVLEDGAEKRQVPILKVGNFEENLVRLIRKDTGAVVEERPMEPDEREVLANPGMFDTDGKPKLTVHAGGDDPPAEPGEDDEDAAMTE